MNKSLVILVVLAVLAIAAGYWLQLAGNSQPTDKQALFTTLDSQANAITQIELQNAAGPLLIAKRANGHWMADVLDEQGQSIGQYPVAQDKLGALVSALAEAKLVEAKTSKSTNYHHLGVQSIEATDSLATLIILSNDKQSWQVLVGNLASVGVGSYVRLPQSKQAWRVDSSIELPMTNSEWLKQPILPFVESDFSKIARVDKTPWLIQRAKAEVEFTLADQPKGRQLKYAGVLDAMAINLASLSFDGLTPVSSIPWDSLTTLVKLDIATFYGHAFTLELAQDKEKIYARFNSELSQDYWLDWVYQISDFSADQLNKTQSDFLNQPTQGESNALQPRAIRDEGDAPK